MHLSSEEIEILKIIEENNKLPIESIALMAMCSEETVKATIEKLEQSQIIISYPTLIDWSKVEGQEHVVAMIDVKVTPKRGVGFDEVAQRIARFPEVSSLYLMSGAYDLSVTVEGKSMIQISQFVSEKLSTIENVISTTTHFMLKKYKHDGVIFKSENDDKDRRMVVTP
ncbi:AsnC family transcriptional regulator [Bacillus sp. AFS076308]|uniref:Lrp/AsnC family transcriptional regulator n=1 Tax=unclassified Bacillus (in: firmicutes) TaxID=185979 RepID=UPI000BF58CB1|nr:MULTISPECIES: Lrp/AsnC family transcriptional regulator [unclassified Bacillus (in: firmicutes)]PFN80196.1 AsnC family transcriptional regulator [Bacillus sp. AFS076308]PGV48380.1 AsnC family transcriptional regulator [Bacillus sp. AFS037270]